MLFLLFVLIANITLAFGPIVIPPINTDLLPVNFSDSEFEACVRENLGLSSSNLMVTVGAARDITELYCSEYNIVNFEDVAKLPNLNQIELSDLVINVLDETNDDDDEPCPNDPPIGPDDDNIYIHRNILINLVMYQIRSYINQNIFIIIQP